MVSATKRDWSTYLAAGGVMRQKARHAIVWTVCYRLVVWAVAGFVLLSFTSPFERVIVALLMLLLSKVHSGSTATVSLLACQTFWNLSYLRRVRPLRGPEVQEYEQQLPRNPDDESADETGRPYDDRWLAHELSTIESDVVSGQREAIADGLLCWVERLVLAGVLLHSCARVLRP